ncbi:DNA-binding protein [Deinococcus sp. QL22]|nr:DNA-binding protein [Deinococcus sp. QL22]
MKEIERPRQQATGDLPTTIGAPARRGLAAAEITHLEHLTQHSEAEVLGLHGLGVKALGILRQALEDQGLAFAPDNPTP